MFQIVKCLCLFTIGNLTGHPLTGLPNDPDEGDGDDDEDDDDDDDR